MNVGGTASTANTATQSPAKTTPQSVPQPSSKSANGSDSVDWNSLVEASVVQKKAPAVRLDLKIKENTTEIKAYQKMQGLMQNLASSLKSIRGSDSSLTRNDDIFSKRQAYLTGRGVTNPQSNVVVTATNGADVRTYDLKILKVATAQKVASQSFPDSKTDLNLEGSFSLKLDGAAGAATTIDIKKDMPLAEIAEAINAKKAGTGVSAAVVKVSETESKLILNADKTGKNILMTPVAGANIGQSLGLVAPGGGFANQLQAATDALVELDGVQASRDSNVIDDLVKGVTFSLYKETGAGNSVSVEVAQSLNDINTAIKGLVDSYNAYRTFAISQQQVATGGQVSADAALFGESILRNANTGIAGALSTTINTESMALLGLSYDPNNMLQIDATKLNDALINRLPDVEKILGFQASSSSADVGLLTRGANMPASLSLDIKTDGNGKITSVLADGKADQFVVSGQRIVGAEGTAYAGMTLVFTGKTDTTANLSFSSGIAERLYQSVTQYSDPQNGLIQKVVTEMTADNEGHTKRYNRMMSDVNQFRTRLIKLFSEYQKEIVRAESDLNYLKAILGIKD
ncbi:flagellar filament capping protein FliD [Labrenzia sp. PHM005]|uniref:flagellar filament capping protein FliD n=1 Tax=Labrenzia sp. PHM005 TaxID=2590016 RepID=UPI0011401FA7|nr:flagellar filament capping protein FliD [Labrenzia sp. PHM005]QDG76086.1 flagellar hook protein [Labrenzia sp. PHM005]